LDTTAEQNREVVQEITESVRRILAEWSYVYMGFIDPGAHREVVDLVIRLILN
jgi:hypothetical protein